MIGLYYLITLPVAWLSITWMIYRLWRRWKPAEGKRKHLYSIVGILIFSFWFGGTFWMVTGKKMYWDSKVRNLCKKDGGITVYETVKLTPDLLDKFGRISIPIKRKADDSNLYILKMGKKILRHSDPIIVRYESTIIRQSDNKILGRSVSYGRSGGDFPGPMHPSSFSCPDPTTRVGIEGQIFIKEE